MCGIAGVFNYGSGKPVEPTLIQAMTQSIKHRGPDDAGVFFDEKAGVGLGHTRLSIIDLATGAQPMVSQSGKFVIVFNGEIYNFRELKSELKDCGYFFRTESDTEVILTLYEKLGVQAFSRLNGIFSIAIYNRETRTIVLARDHFGVKPLYYFVDSEKLVFASEIKAIFKDPTISKQLDVDALGTYLSFRYNPSPETLFQNVKKLPPAHFLSVSSDGQISIQCYWRDIPKVNSHIREEEAAEEYRRLLSQAVKRQLVSDVPIGLFLSGGVDSAALGYLMQEHYSKKIRSFSIGFEGQGDFNELDDARATSHLIASEHEEMTLSREAYMKIFFNSFSFVEEPIAQSTIPALYALSRFASSQVKVVLAGQGADEPLAGYPRYLGAHYISRYSNFLRKLPMQSLSRLRPRNEKLKRAAYVSRFSRELDQIVALHTIFTPEQQTKLRLDSGGRNFSKDYIGLNLYHEAHSLPDTLAKVLYMDTRMSLSDNLLLFNDKLTMAHSLEMRVPFLDLDLVHFIETLPSSFKLKGTKRKYIHKKALEAWLPKEIIYRKKRGFSTPLDDWLKEDEFSNETKALFNASNSGVRRYFNLSYVNELIESHRCGKENYQQQIFALLSFELWHKVQFEESDVDPTGLSALAAGVGG